MTPPKPDAASDRSKIPTDSHNHDGFKRTSPAEPKHIEEKLALPKIYVKLERFS
jgi:hypothetical protein